jgi:hypothetical protein
VEIPNARMTIAARFMRSPWYAKQVMQNIDMKIRFAKIVQTG